MLVYLGLPAPGHVNPTLPVVAELVRRGEHVIYYDSEEFRDPITATGAVFRPYPVPLPRAAEIGRLLEADDLTSVAVLLLQKTVDLVDFVSDELARESPSAVMFDSNALWGAMGARVRGLPSVAFVISLVPDQAAAVPLRQRLRLLGQGLLAMPRFLRARRHLLGRYGPQAFPPRGLFPALGDLNLLFSCPGMQPDTPLVDDTFRLVGTSIDPGQELGAIDVPLTPPLVYVAVGTLMGGSRFLGLCAEALRDHPGTVLMSTGTTGVEVGPLPASFVVRPRVPQLAVLRKAALFVTHGGMNSVHEALYVGVPLVVVAHNAEWAFIGRRVEACGAGLVLGGTPPYGRVTALELRAAVDRVLGEESFRLHAGRLAQSLKAGGGFPRAADEIQLLVARRT